MRGGTISVSPVLRMGRWNGLLLSITGLVGIGVSCTRASVLGIVDVAGWSLLGPSSRGILS